MEEYSDLEFNGDLSFLNENLRASKISSKEKIKAEIINGQGTNRNKTATLNRVKSIENIEKFNDILSNQNTKLNIDQSIKIMEPETAKQNPSHYFDEKISKVEEKVLNSGLGIEIFNNLKFKLFELEKENFKKLKIFLKKETKKEIKKEIKSQTKKEIINKLVDKANKSVTPCSKKSIKNMERFNGTISNENTNSNEDQSNKRMEQEMPNENPPQNGEKKSQLEEMVFNSGYGPEMFNSMKMELLELEKERIIAKYKQELMMYIIKS